MKTILLSFGDRVAEKILHSLQAYLFLLNTSHILRFIFKGMLWNANFQAELELPSSVLFVFHMLLYFVTLCCK